MRMTSEEEQDELLEEVHAVEGLDLPEPELPVDLDPGAEEGAETILTRPRPAKPVGSGTVRFSGAVSRKPVGKLPERFDETIGYRPSPGRAMEAVAPQTPLLARRPPPGQEPAEVTLGFGIAGVNLTLPLALGKVKDATGSLISKSLAEMEIGKLLERRRRCLELVERAYEGLQLAADDEDHDIRANAAAIAAAAARRLAPSNPEFADLMSRFVRDAASRTASAIRGDEALQAAVPAALQELAHVVKNNVGL